MASNCPAQMTRRIAIKRVSALAVALGAIEAVGLFSFAPQRVGASLAPSDIQFDISRFSRSRRMITAATSNSRCRPRLPPDRADLTGQIS